MRKNRKMILGVLAGMAIAVAGLSFGLHNETDPLQPQIASKILRFHVIANSDSDIDQEDKLLVRDAIGSMMEPRLEGAKNLTETKQIVTEALPEIVDTAQNTLKANGCQMPVTARIAKVDFPVKTYGAYTFPEGEYEALQVVIGNGRGHNWWCVLYPNMCFRDSVYEVVGEDKQESLKQVLDEKEYQDVFSGGKYEVRWKFLDYFK